MKAKYISHGEHECQFMTIGKIYEVIGIEADWYRLISDDDDLYLFPLDRIEIIDRSEPDFWVSEINDGVRYAMPFTWSQPGFFEDYHDGVEAVVKKFWEECERYYGISKNV